MPYITLTPEPNLLTARAGDTTLGQTRNALRLQEGGSAPVLYVPRADIDMLLLEKTTRTSTCPHKGLCSYYSVKTPQGVLENAVWSYETPIGAVAEIAGHLAFYPNKVTLS
ncbi:MAG: DUF427 domain-containing protein [Cypionkella sp.]